MKRNEAMDRTEKKVQAVEDKSNKDYEATDMRADEDEKPEKAYYAFYSGNESNVIPCTIGGVKIEMLVDSGADANLISDSAWINLKNERVSVVSSTKGSSRILRAYGSENPLEVLGSFVAKVAVGLKEATAEFLVVRGGQRCLLGDKTAKLLGVLKVGLDINVVKREQTPFAKIRGIKAHIHLDPKFVPVFQPMRRIPIPMEQAVNQKLTELMNRDIIELKSGPASWVSPLVVVGKTNGEPRLCLDLRRVNEAVLRERHPMPAVDDYLARVGKGKIWSKLDIREAFLQIELAEESRDATTFITPQGLFRFKRLPDPLFQKAMDEILTGCEGTSWYIDDVIVEGETLEEHDERLQKVQ
ncbi:uncharacterized protein K02A2.6-like [Aedes albopictus]|uniref:Peptidase A2 domain-containing protein n=1 Tax=Aedes albopictus TaxID=7160 RepID=A0ABM1ZKN0_AEDAL